MTVILANWRGNQADNKAATHFRHHLLEAKGQHMVALVDDNLAVTRNQVLDVML